MSNNTRRITAQEVESSAFTPVRFREGYDMREVDQLLERVVATLTELEAENAALRGTVSTLRDQQPN